MPRQTDYGVIVLVSALVGLGAWAMTTRYWVAEVAGLRYFFQDGAAELRPYADRYGEARYSRNAEEWLIRDFLQDKRGGVFLDVGANHYRDENNTYYLEHHLGWSGVAVDALEEFGLDYATHRPRTKFVAALASDVPDRTVQFFVPETAKIVASSDYAFTARAGTPGTPTQVPTTTLNIVLQQAGIQTLDFVSMDIEPSEPAALTKGWAKGL